MHELNQELERSESSRKRFKSAIAFNRLLKKQDFFAEEITPVKAVTFARYARWGVGSMAALLLVTFSCLQIFTTEDGSISLESVERPIAVRLETKAPLRRSFNQSSIQANFSPMNWESLKKDLQNDPDEMLFLRRQNLPKKQFDGFANVKLTQARMLIQK